MSTPEEEKAYREIMAQYAASIPSLRPIGSFTPEERARLAKEENDRMAKYYAELTKQQNERYAREAKAAWDEYKRQRNAHDKARGWPPTYPDVE